MGKNMENGLAKTDQSAPAPLLFSCRLTLFIVCMITTFSFMFQRINVNFALVCMMQPIDQLNNLNLSPINSTYNTSSILPFQDNETVHKDNVSISKGDIEILENDNYKNDFGGNNQVGDGIECKLTSLTNLSNHNQMLSEFDWSKDTQGAVLASFYYGFIFTQIPGGFFGDRFGAKKTFIYFTAAFSFLTLFNPIAAKLGPEYLFVLRLLQGLVNGGALPSINVLSARWCGARERAFLLGIAYAGFSIASAVTYPIAAFLCNFMGWEWIFYVPGTLGIVCSLCSHFLIFEWPEKHPRIQLAELQYLRKSRAVQYGNGQRTNLNVPWRKLLFSRPIIALLITNFCCYWVFLTMVTYLPTFLKEVMGMDISQNGLYSAIPFMSMMIFHFAVSHIFDLVRKMDFCRLTNLRKIFNTIGMVVPAICLSTIGFLACSSQVEAIFMIAVGLAFTEFAFMGGYLFSVFEVAPRFAGIVTGVTNTFGLLSGFICPALVGHLTANGTRGEWLMVFYFTAGISVFGGIFYLLFGNSELQPWAAAPKSLPDTELKSLQESLISKSNNGETEPGSVHAGRG